MTFDRGSGTLTAQGGGGRFSFLLHRNASPPSTAAHHDREGKMVFHVYAE